MVVVSCSHLTPAHSPSLLPYLGPGQLQPLAQWTQERNHVRSLEALGDQIALAPHLIGVSSPRTVSAAHPALCVEPTDLG
jgi:hypothetical protein